MPSSTYGQFQDALLSPATTHPHMAGRTSIADSTTEKHLLVDSAGHLQVDVVSMSGGGDASASNQTTMIGSLSTIEGDTTSIDGKITACNTGAVVVSSSALPSGASTEATLSTVAGDTTSIDGKITACNTGAVVVSSSALPSGASTEATLSTVAGDTTSLDGKVTVCNTGAVVVSSSALPSGASSEATLAETHFQDGDAIAGASKGVLVMAKDASNNAEPMRVTTSGDVKVTQSASTNHGSQGNISNNASLSNGSTTSAVDVSDISSATVLLEDTSTGSSDGYSVEVSVDNSAFYSIGSIYPTTDGGSRFGYLTDLKLHGLIHLRLKNTSGSTTYAGVVATVVGSSN